MEKLKILYVDDEKTNLINFSIAFKRHFNILTADSGHACLELFENTQDIAVVVANQRMPSMSGVELLWRIKEQEPNTVCIILTVYTDVADILDSINKGKINHYIIKPWNEAELLQLMQKAGEVYALTRENKRLLIELNDKKVQLEADIVRRKRLEAILLRRDMVLAAVNDMARMLLINRDWKSYTEELIGRMGVVMGLCRITIIRHDSMEGSESLPEILFFWIAGEGVPDEIQKPFPFASAILNPLFAGWRKRLEDGGIINGSMSTFQEPAVRDLLDYYHIKSLTLTPIMVKKRCWGIICFEDCIQEREWPLPELEALRTAANLIGTSIMRDNIEENLAVHQTQLAHAGRLTALGEMASGIAHEIHQPLTVINLGAETCKSWFDKYAADSYAAEAATEILSHVAKISNILLSLRSFSRPSSGGCQEILLQGPLREAMNFFREQFKLRGIEYRETIDEELPAVRTDAQKFEQIVVNLLSNARYAVEKRQVNEPYVIKKISVSLVAVNLLEEEFATMYFRSSAICPNRAAILSIRDNGIGMTPEVVNRCFEPFFTTKEVGEGTGLGLSVILALVKELHFHLAIASRQGEGSEFQIVIPLDGKKR